MIVYYKRGRTLTFSDCFVLHCIVLLQIRPSSPKVFPVRMFGGCWSCIYRLLCHCCCPTTSSKAPTGKDEIDTSCTYLLDCCCYCSCWSQWHHTWCRHGASVAVLARCLPTHHSCCWLCLMDVVSAIDAGSRPPCDTLEMHRYFSSLSFLIILIKRFAWICCGVTLCRYRLFMPSRQCFDTVDWVTGRASDL